MHDHINATFNDLLTSLDRTIARLSQPEAQGEPDAKTERRYYESQRRCYAKAQYHHLQGVRPIYSGAAWLITSGSRGGLVHRIHREGGVLVCSCEAGQNGRCCYHKLLVEVAELAADRIDAHDDGLETADPCGGTLPRPRDFDDDAGYAAMLAA
jgi:hypothetical protein